MSGSEVGMKRWAIVVVGVSLAVAAVAIGAVVDLRSDLDDVRRGTRQVELARSLSDKHAERLSGDLRDARAALEEAEKRLESARAERREAWRDLAAVSEVADARFCFNPYDARYSGFVRGPLRADVDADGFDDDVYAVGRPTLLGDDCRYLLVVDAGHTVYRTAVTGRRLWLGDDPGSTFQLYLGPRAAADLDSDGGAEVVLKISQGAAVEAAVAYTLVDGTLERVRFPDEPTDTFSYYGSLCCGGAFDCVDGLVVSSGYGRRGDERGYVVTRKLYRLEGATLVPVRTERHRPKGGGYGGFEEFRGPPLSGCDGYMEMKPPVPTPASSDAVAD
jgi:hypothetical protein